MFLAEEMDDDENPVPEMRTLDVNKLNNGREDDGVIRLAQGPGDVLMRFGFTFCKGEGAAEDAELAEDADATLTDADQAFVTKMRKYLASGRTLSHKPRADNYAPEALAMRYKGKPVAASVKKNQQSLQCLFWTNAIWANYDGARSDGVMKIVIRRNAV
jgi:hypothetical protein